MENGQITKDNLRRDMEIYDHRRSLSARIDKHLMEFVSANTWDPFNNISDAWMIASKFKFSVFPSGMDGWTAKPPGSLQYYLGATACEAICEAALSLIHD